MDEELLGGARGGHGVGDGLVHAARVFGDLAARPHITRADTLEHLIHQGEHLIVAELHQTPSSLAGNAGFLL